MASFFCFFLPEASLDCQFYVFLTNSHQPLLNHLLPPARGCWQSPFPALGLLGAPQQPGGAPISTGCPMLVLEPPVGTVGRTSQEKINTSFFCGKINFHQSRSFLSRNHMSLPTYSTEEITISDHHQWKKSQVFNENFYIFVFNWFSTNNVFLFFKA